MLKKSVLKTFFSVIIYTIVFSAAFSRTCCAAVPINKKIITIDAGHGQWDPGKLSKGINEKDINLAVAERLQMLLELGGAVVFVTRADDTALAERKREDLRARAELANAAGSNLYISIHQNSYGDESVSGPQVFYHESSEQSKQLAGKIQEQLNGFLEGRDREAKASDSYYVLMKTNMPAVIVECGFMSNTKELKKLLDDEYQNKLAWAVYAGILKYFEETP